MEERIRELRKMRGIGQEILASEIGVTQQTISKLENGKYKAPTDLLINIAGYFEVSVDYLLGLTDMKRNWEGHQRLDRKLDEYYEGIKVYEELSEANQETIRVLLLHLRESQRRK